VGWKDLTETRVDPEARQKMTHIMRDLQNEYLLVIESGVGKWCGELKKDSGDGAQAKGTRNKSSVGMGFGG